MQDQELRDQFDEWAEPLRATPAPAVAALHSRIRRRTARIAAAAASVLAVVGVAVGSLAVSSSPGSRTHGPASHQAQQAWRGGLWGSAKYPAPPGQPYVFVNSSATFEVPAAHSAPAEIRNAATGQVVKVLHPLGPGAVFTSAIAAQGDRQFLLAEQENSGATRFDRVTIGPGGAPVTLSRVLPGVSLPSGAQPFGLTVNAAATRMAFNVSSPAGPSGTLMVYNLTTGALIGRWRTDSYRDVGTTVESFQALPQFVGTGNELAVLWPSAHGPGQLREVNATKPFAAGSAMLADSRPDPVRSGTPGLLTQDGTVALVASRQADNEFLTESAASSGNLLRKIRIGPAKAENGPYYCGVLWASANGADLLTQCGSEQQAITNGHAMRVKLPWLMANSGLAEDTFAW
jgi:hypothetical protein